MAKSGQPTKYRKEYCALATNYCLLGAKDSQLADYFNIVESTLNKWKLDYPEFSEALKKGKEQADMEIAQSLFHRAKGYSHKDVHISNYQGDITLTDTTKHYAPDTTAAIFWLKNRNKDNWRDRHEVTGKDGEPLYIPIVKRFDGSVDEEE